MGHRKLFGKVMLVMVALIIAGGVGVAVFSAQSGLGEFGPSAVLTSTSTEGYGFGAAGSVGSGSSVPSTIVLGPQYASGETETVTASTTTMAGTSDQLTSPAGANSSGGSGHSIEFFGSIAVDVPDPSAGIQQVSTIAAGLGGYVAATEYDSTQNGTATITVMVPSQSFQAALAQLEGLGKVASLQSSSDDVSVQYEDLNATLASLVTEQGSLLKLLNQSTSINSTIQIESILQQTDAEINSVESQIIQTAQLVNYASISVTLQTEAKSPAVAPLTMKLSATPRAGLSPLSVTFDAIVSGGEGPYVVNYNFGDGTSSEGQQLIHQFDQPGTYNVTVSATDQAGNVTLASVIVKVSAPPAASGLSTFAGLVWGLFSSVVEGIIEVAVVVIPVGLVAFGAYATVWRRYSKTKTADTKGDSKT